MFRSTLWDSKTPSLMAAGPLKSLLFTCMFLMFHPATCMKPHLESLISSSKCKPKSGMLAWHPEKISHRSNVGTTIPKIAKHANIRHINTLAGCIFGCVFFSPHQKRHTVNKKKLPPILTGGDQDRWNRNTNCDTFFNSQKYLGDSTWIFVGTFRKKQHIFLARMWSNPPKKQHHGWRLRCER